MAESLIQYKKYPKSFPARAGIKGWVKGAKASKVNLFDYEYPSLTSRTECVNEYERMKLRDLQRLKEPIWIPPITTIKKATLFI